jgi:hypothetical protein
VQLQRNFRTPTYDPGQAEGGEEEEEEEGRLCAYNGAAADGDALLPKDALFSLIQIKPGAAAIEPASESSENEENKMFDYLGSLAPTTAATEPVLEDRENIDGNDHFSTSPNLVQRTRAELENDITERDILTGKNSGYFMRF